MPSMVKLLVFVVALLIASTPGWARDTTTRPYPGVTHLHRTTAAPLNIHALTIDLSLRTIRIRATQSADRRQTVSRWARDQAVEVAINGDFFSYEDYDTSGWAMGAGGVWPGSTDRDEGFVAFGRNNHVILSNPPVRFGDAEAWMSEIVSGRPYLVAEGAALDINCVSHYCERHPRTAVGISAEGQRLFLVVVDGRSNASRGMTTPELATLMVGLGADRALNLDGGGSTTMYVANEDGVLNSPSDGGERVVANHLGVDIVEPFGELTGFVRQGSVQNDAAPIVHARVELSTGAAAQTDGVGRYRFARVAAGPVSIAVTKVGFAPAGREVDVAAADTTWGSVALLAEAPDAADRDLDASLSDAEVSADAGPFVESAYDSGTITDARNIAADPTPEVSMGPGDTGVLGDAAPEGPHHPDQRVSHTGQCLATPGRSTPATGVIFLLLFGVLRKVTRRHRSLP